MKPMTFEEQNVVFARDQKQYQPLPASRVESKRGLVFCCWKMSVWERLWILFTGKIWVSLLSFNNPLTPSYLFTNKKEIEVIKQEETEFDKTINR